MDAWPWDGCRPTSASTVGRVQLVKTSRLPHWLGSAARFRGAGARHTLTAHCEIDFCGAAQAALRISRVVSAVVDNDYE